MLVCHKKCIHACRERGRDDHCHSKQLREGGISSKSDGFVAIIVILWKSKCCLHVFHIVHGKRVVVDW